MNCDKCREYFDEFLSGSLSSSIRENVRAHTGECSECRDSLERFSIIRNGFIFASQECEPSSEQLSSIKAGVMEQVAQLDITKPESADDGSEFTKQGKKGELTGTTLDNYEVYEEIGRGGMGTVYRAKQLSMDRFVALKVLNTKFSQDDSFINKFLTEARSAGKLNHLNMITVHQVGCSGDKYFFAMEYVDGETVQEMLDRKEVIKPMNAIRIAMQVAEALKYAHSQGIIHRDVKPDNIMIDKMGVAKLADLGIATSFKDNEEQDLTKQKKVVGTPHYMSPEQARGEEVDFRSDIYSLGASLFHMMTGEPPFRGRTTMETLKMRLRENVPSAKERNNLIPDQVDKLVQKMMSKEKQGRHADYDVLKTAFQKILDTSETGRVKKQIVHKKHDMVPIAPRRSGTPKFALLGAAAVVAVAVIGWIVFKSMNPDTSPRTVVKSSKGTSGESTGETPAKTTKPVNFEDRALRQKKERMLEELLGDVRDSDNFEDNIAKLQDFKQKNPRIKPHVVKNTIEDQTRRLQRSAIAKVNKQAVAAIAVPRRMKDYGKCLEILDSDWAEKYKEVHAENLFNSLKGEIEKSAQSEYNELQAKANEFLKKGAYKGAHDKIDEAGIFHLASIDKQIGSFKKRIEQTKKNRMAAQERRNKEESARLLVAFNKALQEPIGKLDFEEAESVCRRFMSDRKYTLIKSDIENAKRDMGILQGLETIAAASINEMTGKTYKFKLNDNTYFKEATIKGYSNGLISLSDPEYPGLTFGLKFNRLSFEEVMRLSQQKLESSKKGDDHGTLFLGHLYSGNISAAKDSLIAAAKLKAGRVDHYKNLYTREATMIKENKARELIEEIQTLVKRKDVGGLTDRIKELEEKYGDTAVFKENKAILDYAAGELEFTAQADKLKNHINGKLVLGKNRNFEVIYDFKHSNQLKDWNIQLGSWRATGQGLEGGISKWHDNVGEYRSSMTYFLPMSGEIEISLTVDTNFNLSAYQGCALILGHYRLELPLADPENKEANRIGISKLDPEMSGYLKLKKKPLDMRLEPRGKYTISMKTAKEGETAFLTLKVGEYEKKLQLQDGLPENAQIGLYAGPSTSTKTVFSNLRINGTFTRDMSAYVLQRAYSLTAMQRDLDAGKTVPIFNGKNLFGWTPSFGWWEVQSGMIKARMRGFLEFDIPLEQYELTARIFVNPPGSTTRKFDHVAFAMGIDGQGSIYRVGFSPSWNNQPFRGWEVARGFNSKIRYGQQEVPAANIISERTKPLTYRVQYTKSSITCFVDGEKVFSCPNKEFQKGKKTRCGLLNRWGTFWFRDITLRKLN